MANEEKYGMMKILREIAPKVSPEEFQKIIKQHAVFLEHGGGGGKWQTMSMNEGPTGIVMGIYLGKKPSEGKQAELWQKNLEGLPLKEANLSYANFVGSRCQNQSLDTANLKGICATDSDFSGSSFKNANLQNADFSRALLVNCDFTGANLAGVDFQNAKMDGSLGIEAPSRPIPSSS